MNELTLSTAQNQTNFLPGEEVQVTAAWSFERAPDSLLLRLVWFTRGKGTDDVEVVREIALKSPQAAESRQVVLPLPQSPFSFSGKLISLLWTIELIAWPSEESTRLDIVIGPERREVLLVPAN